MKLFAKTFRLLVIGSLYSPPAMLLRATFLLAVFGAFHLLGWRDDTRILSGTMSPSDGAVARGLLYAAFYFSAVILCPILILAAGIQMLMQRVLPRWK